MRAGGAKRLRNLQLFPHRADSACAETCLRMISVVNRQRRIQFDLRWLRKAASIALPICRDVSADSRFQLKDLPEISVAIVGDAAIAQVHQDFMNIPGPTDVITFEHGEIVMSAE